MSRFGPALALLLFQLAVASPVLSQLTEADRARLAEQIDVAATQLDPTLFPDLDQSKADVLRRVESVDTFLAARTDARNRQGWLDYLGTGPLVKSIDTAEPPGVIAAHAVDLRYRLIGTAPGLELTVMRELRRSVEQLIAAILFRDRQRAIESIAKQLDSLADRVRQLDDSPSADDFATISAVIGVVRSSGQADQLIRSMRNTFSRPNVAVLVGEPMVQDAIGREVHRIRPVRDCILGTRIIGTASMDGVVTANLLPAFGAARINITLAGHVTSDNIGYNGPVRLRTSGCGDVTVSRELSINKTGIALTPANSQVGLRSKIHRIEHPLGLVRHIARRKATQQKPKADRIAAERMRLQVGSTFSTRTSEVAAKTSPDVVAEIRPLLKRLSLEEPTQFWSSSQQAISIDSVFRRDDQLASVVSRPSVGSPFHIAVQIHESAIDNAMAPVLAGRTLGESRLKELLEKAGRPMQADDDPKGEAEPTFEIDFARLRPIIFEARDQSLRLGVRGTRFAQGNRELKQAMEITANYRSEITGDGIAVLRRQGEVDVSFPGRKRLSVGQTTLRRTIQRKFSDVFPERVLDQSLDVPADSELDTLRGRRFYPRTVDARDGWLTITLR